MNSTTIQLKRNTKLEDLAVNYVRVDGGAVGGDQIVRMDTGTGGSWLDDGYGLMPSEPLLITGSPVTNGTYTIASATTPTLTLTVSNTLTATRVTTNIQFLVDVVSCAPPAGCTNTSYRIIRTDAAAWATATNFTGGGSIVVTNAGSNNGTYT